MRTLVYIDGFNFYYRNVKNTPNKWLDFKKFFELLLGPKHQILKIKYFTALVTGKVDPHQPVRQETFLRALQKHIPELSIYYGHFLSHDKYMPLSYPIDKRSLGEDIKFAQVIKTEEKGSDVNLAVHLLNDAWLNEYDCAVIASNDSDLVESFKFIKTLHSKRIGLILPRTGHPSKVLMRHADFKKKIRMNALAKCQIPFQGHPSASQKCGSAWGPPNKVDPEKNTSNEAKKSPTNSTASNLEKTRGLKKGISKVPRKEPPFHPYPPV